MKLLVFAHKPPPHHGQSYMVQLLIESLGGDVRARPADAPLPPIECYHLDARFSSESKEIGHASFGKGLMALRYVVRAIGWRFRHGIQNLYYVPAPSLRAPLYRDWIILGICRLFFRRTILHWHAAGLGEWLQRDARPWERWISKVIYAKANVSIVLRAFSRIDAEILGARRIAIVPNGIPDPCPNFDTEVLPRRLARAKARQERMAGAARSSGNADAAGAQPEVFQILFLSLCTREKGLFDAIDAVALALPRFKAAGLRLRLSVAGTFWVEAEKKELEERIRKPDVQDAGEPAVTYHGFATGDAKRRLLLESDCLVFPTYYAGESFPLVLLEALGIGLPIVTSTWRDIAEILPPNSAEIVPPRSPDKLADALIAMAGRDYDPRVRGHFLAHYTEERFAVRMREVLLEAEKDSVR